MTKFFGEYPGHERSDRLFRRKKWNNYQNDYFVKRVKAIVRTLEPDEIWPYLRGQEGAKPVMVKLAVRYFDVAEQKYKWAESGIHDYQNECIDELLEKIGHDQTATIHKCIKYRIPMMWRTNETRSLIESFEKRKQLRESGQAVMDQQQQEPQMEEEKPDTEEDV